MESHSNIVRLPNKSERKDRSSFKRKRRFGCAFSEEEPGAGVLVPPRARSTASGYTGNTPCSSNFTVPCQNRVLSDALCKNCRSFNLNKISKMTIKNHRGAVLEDLLGTVQELRDSTCPLCNLFYSMAPSDFDAKSNPRTQECHLRAFSANFVFARLDNRTIQSLRDGILLAVLRADPGNMSTGVNGAYTQLTQSTQETGYLSLWPTSQPVPHFGARTVDPERCDFDFMMNCLQYCQAHHHKSCHVNSKDKRTLEAWKVIDCIANKIVPASADCDYVALSYVWGLGENIDTVQEFGNAPRVIRDAMDVTLRLSFRYLWVDRYCIDYADKTETAAQISQMDLIYSQATLTIVAAAGDSPKHGLPGVTVAHRIPQLSARVEDMLLVSTFPHPSWTVGRTKWASRGWTYQEQVLSKRLIVFTDCQVLYECEGMHCAESRVQPLDVMHCSSGTRLKKKVPSGAFVHRTLGQDPLDIVSCISEFKMRQLTMNTDNLHALEGVFQVFSRAKKPARALMGIPITKYKRSGPKSSKLTEQTSEQAFIAGLSWYHPHIAERLVCFPSWTWAGWEGPIKNSLLLERSGGKHEYARICLHTQAGTRMEISNSQQAGHDLSSQACSNTISLDIDAWTFEIPKTAFLRAYKDDVYRVRILSRFDELVFVQFYPDRNLDFLPKTGRSEFGTPITDFKPKSSEENLTAVILAEWLGKTVPQQENETFALVVEQRNGYAERVGCFLISKKEKVLKRRSYFSGLVSSLEMQQLLQGIPKRRQIIRVR